MPPQIHSDPPFDPAMLSGAERDQLAADVYAVHRQIFDGVSLDAFRAYVIDAPAARNRLQLFRNDAGAVVGYVTMHLYDVSLRGRVATVARSEVGLLPAYRGQSVARTMYVRELLRMLVCQPFRRHYFVACPVHPASYYVMARTNLHLHPRPDAAPSDEIAALYAELDAQLHLTQPAGTGAHVRSVGWITRQDDDEAAFWRQHRSPLIRFFLAENPEYREGHGLRVVSAVSAGIFARGLLTLARNLLKRRLRRRPRLQVSVAGGQS